MVFQVLSILLCWLWKRRPRLRTYDGAESAPRPDQQIVEAQTIARFSVSPPRMTLAMLYVDVSLIGDADLAAKMTPKYEEDRDKITSRSPCAPP